MLSMTTWGASFVKEAEITPIEPEQVMLLRNGASPYTVLLFNLIFYLKDEKNCVIVGYYYSGKYK